MLEPIDPALSSNTASSSPGRVEELHDPSTCFSTIAALSFLPEQSTSLILKLVVANHQNALIELRAIVHIPAMVSDVDKYSTLHGFAALVHSFKENPPH